jgi:hypothetical protein
VVPRSTRKRQVTKESSRDGIACSLTHFRVFSQVGNLGCIEFLNRESQVRFLPGARCDVAGHRADMSRDILPPHDRPWGW